MYPGFSADRRTFIGPSCDIRVAAGGRMRLTSCAVARNVTLTAGDDAELLINADYIGHGSTIVARRKVSIGRGTKIAENSVIRDANHDHSVPLAEMKFLNAELRVGDDVWVGAGATILSGVEVGSHSSIGAGAVVTRTIPPRSVAVGVPARVR